MLVINNKVALSIHIQSAGTGFADTFQCLGHVEGAACRVKVVDMHVTFGLLCQADGFVYAQRGCCQATCLQKIPAGVCWFHVCEFYYFVIVYRLFLLFSAEQVQDGFHPFLVAFALVVDIFQLLHHLLTGFLNGLSCFVHLFRVLLTGFSCYHFQ